MIFVETKIINNIFNKKHLEYLGPKTKEDDEFIKKL